MQRGDIRWRRDLLISAILAALILALQLLIRSTPVIALISAIIAFAVALGVLAVSDRFSRR
ncbi:hypothetical protein [uncultured Amnibacterium sp.]|uniref:hypothetical protein n=1 Tax=uncultured Amnibacterium sp. TaxID=1631851 RepID=UPI0035CC6248